VIWTESIKFRFHQRFENRVSETLNEEILARFFAQVVIDPEYLMLSKTERMVALSSELNPGLAERFLDDDLRMMGVA